MNPIDLVFHDWMNLSPEERETAVNDIRALAKTFGEPSPNGAGRRARSLNIAASFFHFLAPPPRCGARRVDRSYGMNALCELGAGHEGEHRATIGFGHVEQWSGDVHDTTPAAR